MIWAALTIFALSDQDRQAYAAAFGAALKTPEVTGLMAELRPGCRDFVFGTPGVEAMQPLDSGYLAQGGRGGPMAVAHVTVTGCGDPVRLNYSMFRDADGDVALLPQFAGESLNGAKAQQEASGAAALALPEMTAAGCGKPAIVADTRVVDLGGWSGILTEDWTVRRCGVSYHLTATFHFDGMGDWRRVSIGLAPGEGARP